MLQITGPLFSQQPATNLIPNPSFENVITSGFSCPGFINDQMPTNPPYPYFDWSKVQYWQGPDGISQWHVNGYSRWMSAFCEPTLPFEARTGSSWGQNQIYGNTSTQNNSFGYFCSPLTNTLIPGHYYYVSFYTRWSNGLTGGYGNQWGAVFANDKVHQNSNNVIDNITPEISEVTSSNSYEFTWHRIHGIFKATSWNDWINIGSFDHNTVVNSWYALDDITVIDLGEDECTSQWLIENTTYEHTQEIFEAENRIDAGNDVGFNDLNGPVIVFPTANITYKAGNEIGLKDGFAALEGSIFHAYIAPCGVYCPGGGMYTLNISTGSGISPGQDDDKWKLAQTPANILSPPLPLKRLNPQYSAWVYPHLSDYDWINADYLPNNEGSWDGYHTYSLHFDIPDATLIDQFYIEIDRIAVDNSVTLRLNGQPLPISGLDPVPGTDEANFQQLHGPYTIHNSITLQDLKDIIHSGINNLTATIYTENVFMPEPSFSKTGFLMRGSLVYGTCEDNQLSIFYPKTHLTDYNDGIHRTSLLKIYPNPNEGTFNLVFNSIIQMNSEIKITDLFGKIVYRQSIIMQEGINQTQISSNELAPGTYFVKVDGIDETIKVFITN
jgi:hypothetical protein